MKVNKKKTIGEVLKVLNEQPEKIALVLDETERLIGTVTDGDVRRGFIDGFTIKDNITNIMNSNPRYCNVKDTDEHIQEVMQIDSLKQMPIVDNNRRVVRVVSSGGARRKSYYSNAVIIMAGGFGTRLRPLTNDIPKPMLKIGHKPLLLWIIEGFIEAGFSHFFISTHYKGEVIADFFKDGREYGVNIDYLHENEPLGTAGALGLLPPNFEKYPIILINGDILTNVDFNSLMTFHDSNNFELTVCAKPYEVEIPFAVLDAEKCILKNISEKPVKSFIINAGIYVLSRSALELLQPNEKIDMPNLISKMLDRNMRLGVFPIHENWLDIGQMHEFKRANNEVMTGKFAREK